MKKIVASIGFAVLVSACHYGTGKRFKIYTPEEFLNDSRIGRSEYTKDSVQLLSELRSLLKNHEYSFYSKEYFDSTELIIDTIVYNKPLDRLAVFVLSRNPTYRQLSPDPDHKWYYDATSYLGLKKQDTILLAWLGPNFSNAVDQGELSKIVRDEFFTAFADNDTTNGWLYRYNLNDKRFWEGPIWKKKFDEPK